MPTIAVAAPETSSIRYRLGISVLTVALLLPWTAPLVTFTDWPAATKTLVGSTIAMSFEILIFPAIALLGRDGWGRVKERIVGRLSGVRRGFSRRV
jgi:hypothetical protein